MGKPKVQNWLLGHFWIIFGRSVNNSLKGRKKTSFCTSSQNVFSTPKKNVFPIIWEYVYFANIIYSSSNSKNSLSSLIVEDNVRFGMYPAVFSPVRLSDRTEDFPVRWISKRNFHSGCLRLPEQLFRPLKDPFTCESFDTNFPLKIVAHSFLYLLLMKSRMVVFASSK